MQKQVADIKQRKRAYNSRIFAYFLVALFDTVGGYGESVLHFIIFNPYHTNVENRVSS